MKNNQIGIVPEAAGSSPVTGLTRSKSRFTRREMLELTGVSGVATFTAIAPNAVAQTAQKRPRIACLVSYWGLPTSHADWIVNKLIDGYWWRGAHTPSRVDVVSVYIHQLDTGLLGQKVCKAKNIPIFKTVSEAVTLGGKELAVDGVVIVAEHGNYPTDLKATGFCRAGGSISKSSRSSSRANARCPCLMTSTSPIIGTTLILLCYKTNKMM